MLFKGIQLLSNAATLLNRTVFYRRISIHHVQLELQDKQGSHISFGT